MWIETHCHVADTKFDADRDDAFARAQAAGVSTFIEIAESPSSWDAAIALAERHPFVYASLGIHPHHAHLAGANEWPALEARLRTLLAHPKVVAIGEFGLDYFRMQNTKEEQDFLFRQQLKLAKELSKPVVIHCRDAHEDTQRGLQEFYPETSVAVACPSPVGVIHCFTGSWPDAQWYLAHGFMLGIDGPLTYPSAKQLQENVRRLPLERMVLETDSPYLPPQTHRGQRNEPSYIPAIADAMAVLKYATRDDVALHTSQNAKALFRL